MVLKVFTFLPYKPNLSCTRLRILLNTISGKPGVNSLKTPLNHGAEQASNETLKQTQQRNWSNASQGGQTALKHFAVLHYETASTTQQPRGEHRDTIKDCKIAGATTWQGQGNHTFTTQTLSIPPQQRSPMITARISHYLLWRSNRRLWTKQTLKTLVATAKAAYTCKLLRLLPDRRIFRLIMGLVDNRSFTLSTGNDKRSRLRRLKNGVPHRSILAPFFSTSTSLITLSRNYAYANDLLIMYAVGDWLTVEGILRKDIANVNEYL